MSANSYLNLTACTFSHSSAAYGSAVYLSNTVFYATLCSFKDSVTTLFGGIFVETLLPYFFSSSVLVNLFNCSLQNFRGPNAAGFYFSNTVLATKFIVLIDGLNLFNCSSQQSGTALMNSHFAVFVTNSVVFYFSFYSFYFL